MVIAAAILHLLVSFAPASLPRRDDIAIDATTWTFAPLVSVGSSLLFGLIPVLRHAAPRMAASLRAGDRSASATRGQHRTRNTLVVVQVAVAIVLLVGSGLMIRTFVGLRGVRPGLTDPEEVLLVRLSIPRTLVADPERVFQMQRDIRDRVATLPGVTAAAMTSAAPMEPFVSANVLLFDGVQSERRSWRFKFVSPGYFGTVGTPVVAGRDFAWNDLDRRRPLPSSPRRWRGRCGGRRRPHSAGACARVPRHRGAKSPASWATWWTMVCMRRRQRSPTGRQS